MLRHDIRNDLQVISGYAGLAEDHVDEEAAGHLATIQETTEDAVDLTRTARDLAEVLLQPELSDQRIHLADTLEQQVEETRSGHRDAIVTIERPLPQTTVQADEMASSVFRNLLENAIQHNDKDIPEVNVTVEEKDSLVEVQVADNGPGVPESQKDEIFGRGEKGPESEGTGIGLYLVNTLVTRYGGNVWVEDNNPEGAVFIIELPIAE